MAIVVREVCGRQGSLQLEKKAREYRRTFDVFSDDTEDESDVIAAVAAVTGNVGSPHPVDSRALLTKIDAQQTEQTADGIRAKWSATANWTSDIPYDPDKQEDDPTDQAPTYEFTFSKIEESVEIDVNNQTILNSAGDPFADGLVVPRTVVNIKVSKNIPFANFSFPVAAAAVNRVNNDTWQGFTANQCLLESLSANEKKDNGVHMMAVTYTVAIKEDGWQPRLLDAGYEYLSPAILPKKLKFESGGQPASRPQLLDGDGRPLEANGTPFYMTYTAYRSMNFTALGI